jgi:hypothetical protein
MSAMRNVMELVDRKLEILDAEERVTQNMPQGQTTEDFFTRLDRTELIRQGVQNEQILRDLAEIKITAKENARDAMAVNDVNEKRIRALEDDRLQFRTQMQTSWRWVVLASAVVGGLANFLIKLVWK